MGNKYNNMFKTIVKKELYNPIIGLNCFHLHMEGTHAYMKFLFS
jgi:hypothetical protein